MQRQHGADSGTVSCRAAAGSPWLTATGDFIDAGMRVVVTSLRGWRGDSTANLKNHEGFTQAQESRFLANKATPEC